MLLRARARAGGVSAAAAAAGVDIGLASAAAPCALASFLSSFCEGRRDKKGWMTTIEESHAPVSSYLRGPAWTRGQAHGCSTGIGCMRGTIRRRDSDDGRTPLRPSNETENASRCVRKSNGAIVMRCLGGTWMMSVKKSSFFIE